MLSTLPCIPQLLPKIYALTKQSTLCRYLFPEIEGDPLLVGFDEEDLDAEDVSEFTGRSPAAKSSPLTIGK
jgi:hypothetical protein